MIGDWVKETTTTTGTGTITLAGAESGYCSFSDLFADDMIVRYQILDANGTSREAGYGTIGGSGTTLTRDTVIETLVGGTYDASAPSAITLTSGTHTVSIAADAQAFEPSPMGRNDSTLINSAHINAYAGNTTVTMTADRQYAMPFQLLQTTNCAQLGVVLGTGVDASTSTIGITQMVDGDPAPAYLAQGSIVLTTANNGSYVQSNITDVILHPGWYFMHIISDAAPVVYGVTAASHLSGAPLDTNNTGSRAFPIAQYWLNSASADGSLVANPQTASWTMPTAVNHIACYISTT